ncbi:L antigen family member 3-like isoform X1 [Tachysurus fulvidraco]|uniref:L antigen family member 3-like isoform X1 n=1 Tax=Tachysurus fulvidraco TaxID=1234273 RepID=UPI000F513EA4|nr:L antigen family member 3-like isoform X1 [Tachysurus fulvidraco]
MLELIGRCSYPEQLAVCYSCVAILDHFSCQVNYNHQDTDTDQDWYVRTLEVPLPSQKEVSIALRSLSPDHEPRTGATIKSLSASANALSVKWNAVEARSLRVSVGSFLDHLALIMETMDSFGQPDLQ